MTDKLFFIISNDLTWFISFQLNLKLTVNMANVLKESNAFIPRAKEYKPEVLRSLELGLRAISTLYV